MCAVGILIPQALWVIDFAARALGFSLTGMTDYMFNPNSSLFLRGLSLFHGWLPFMLVYLVWKLGYDRRGLPAWTVLAWVLLLVCFFLMPPPRPDPGPDAGEHQLRVGHERPCGADLGLALCLARRTDDRSAGHLLPHAPSARPLRARRPSMKAPA